MAYRIAQRHYSTCVAPLRLLSKASLLTHIHSINNVQLPSGPFDTTVPCHATSTDLKSPSKYNQETLIPFFLHHPETPGAKTYPLGFLRPSVANALLNDHFSQLEADKKSCWSFRTRESHTSGLISTEQVCTLSFSPHISNKALRRDIIARIVEKWKHAGMFLDILKGWSDEECPVYLPSNVDRTTNGGESLAFTIQRAALPLFGFPNFGALLVGFCETGPAADLKLWIARRSLSKRTFPGLLDVVAGGCVNLGEPPIKSAIREGSEEASLPTSYVAKHIRSTGSIPFSNRSPAGWLLPGLYHTFELPFPADLSISPKTNAKDGEVENFALMGAQECLDNILAGKFKPSSALVILNFMIQRGLYSPVVDVNYDAVLQAMRKDLIVPIS